MSGPLVHRYWQGRPHPLTDWTRSAIYTTHRGAVLREWGPDDLAYPGLTNDPKHASNVVRYQVLLDHGGLWLDHDVIPLRDLTTLHEEPWVASLGEVYQNCVMYFPEPGHPVLAELLRRAQASSPDLVALKRSGVTLLNQVFTEDRSRIRKEPRALPFDARGRATGVDAVALHLWDSATRPVPAGVLL